jgi:hypothetical protein
MSPFLVVVAVLVGHAVGNFSHAENIPVKSGHTEMIVRMDGDVADRCK